MGRALQPGVDKIPESWVKQRVKDILNEFKRLHWDMPPASQYGTAGRHDFLICQRGLFWTVETKCGRNKPTELQKAYAQNIRRAGGVSLWVNEYNVEDVRIVAGYVNLCLPLPDWQVDDGGFLIVSP